jgi:ribonucleoside-triphosphate reductase
MKLRCGNCGYEWEYKGKGYYATCPKCRWKVSTRPRTEKKRRKFEPVEFVENYLNQRDWKVRENANIPFSFSSLFLQGANEVIAEYVLKRVYPPEISRAHIEGDFHIHNIGWGIIGYCSGWSIKDLLLMGFGGVPARTESSPPKHFSSALLQISNFLGSIQNEWAGAQAVNALDVYLAPFIRKDGLGFEEIKQRIQEFIYNLNISSRWGGQTPFTNVTLEMKVPEDMKSEPIIIGGKLLDETYGDYQPEIDLFNKAFLEVLLEGDARGRVFTFPIPTVNITPDFPWDSEVSDLLFKVTAKFGSFYFQNCVKGGLDPREIRAMCCLSPETLVVIKDQRGIRVRPIGQLRNVRNLEVLTPSGFRKSTWFKVPAKEWIEVTFWNGQKVRFTPDHPCLTREGLKLACELKPGDYLPFLLRGYDGEGGSYELGRFIGLYVAEGSKEKNMVVFSLEPGDLEAREFIKKFVKENFGCQVNETTIRSGIGNRDCLLLRIPSKTVKSLIEDFVGGGNAKTKWLKAKVFGMSRAFRQGLWDGWREGDKSSRDRICTVSKRLRDDAVALLASLGKHAGIAVDKRNGRLSRDPLFYVRPYTGKRKRYGTSFWIEGDQLWMKVDKVVRVKVKKQTFAYDFEVHDDNHLFVLANGLITHNCRLQLDLRELYRRYGFFGYADKTGSVGVVTINMPRIGFLSKEEREFFERLDRLLELAKESLEIKRRVVEKLMGEGLLPFSARYLGSLRWHFSTIGLIGMHEACLNFLGEGIEAKQGKEFAIKVLKHMRERIREFQEETGNLYNLEATPAEGASYRLARLDKERFPKIKTAGKDVPYYTNSTWLPVGYTNNLAEALRHQEDLQVLYNGGTVFHAFLGESPHPSACKLLVKRIAENFAIPYYTLTPTFSICPDHGYLSGEHWNCPTCGKPCEVYSRIVGYYRPVQNWHIGKQEEFRERLEYLPSL